MKYTSLNKTSFTALGGKITEAMSHILNTGESVRLKNRKDEPWLLITLAKHHDRGYTFQFITADGQEVGDIVLKASVKYWSDPDHIKFWTMHGEAWELAEHPVLTAARKAALAESERVHENLGQVTVVGDSITCGKPLMDGWSPKDINALVSGATHKVHSWGGTVLYGAYQRDWLFRKRLYILRGTEWVKATPEFLNTVRWVEEMV
ncbi:virion structural protein [Pseudomonas phage phi15]|uniref:Virion structural protein n=1 Tax=Pseudomonas phage phi15 TaxID=988656 RepID=F0V6W8_9CAUD|nr:virion structural protein [Pseudomonas phage phi15]CBZ41980.1 virion structural protein [Pseudomonas phage phi15]